MSEAVLDGKDDRTRPTAEFLRRRRARSIAIAVALAVLVGLFYAVTIAKLGSNILNRPL